MWRLVRASTGSAIADAGEARFAAPAGHGADQRFPRLRSHAGRWRYAGFAALPAAMPV